jgi:hypothetical protein
MTRAGEVRRFRPVGIVHTYPHVARVGIGRRAAIIHRYPRVVGQGSRDGSGDGAGRREKEGEFLARNLTKLPVDRGG